MSFKKILLPVDGSEHSYKAAKHALDLARCNTAQVVLMHCLEPIPSLIGGEARAMLEKEARAQAEGPMNKAWEEMKQAGISFSTRLEHGDPAQTILRVADEEKCDVIFMGTKGLGTFQGLVLGSVTTKVLHSAAIPVLVVR